MRCPACQCTVVRWAAYLGRVLWAECRACGMQFQVSREDALTTEQLFEEV